MTQRWGVTCKECGQPAFCLHADKLPKPDEMVTAGMVSHLDDTPLDIQAALFCDSCHVQINQVGHVDTWVELAPFECRSCGCGWATAEGRRKHLCVHGRQCVDSPFWRENRHQFGRYADWGDVQSVISAIDLVIKRRRKARKRVQRKAQRKIAA